MLQKKWSNDKKHYMVCGEETHFSPEKLIKLCANKYIYIYIDE